MVTYLAQRALEPDGPSYPTVPWFSRVPDAKVQPIVDYWAHRLTDTARMALSLDSFWPCQADYLAYVEQGSEAHDRFDRATPEQIERMVQSHPGAITVPIGVPIFLLAAVASGRQGVLMAPTEILAEQHWLTVSSLLAPLGIRVTLLTNATRGKARRALLAALAAVQQHEQDQQEL